MHILLDGCDVNAKSALIYVEQLEYLIKEVKDDNFDKKNEKTSITCCYGWCRFF